jgi:uncharacterized protein RhaS with RHS repeats
VIPEQSATIYDGTNAYWSAKYTYTEFNAVATRQDARGVITTYSYDGLHHPYNISYDTTNAPGVASTPSVSLGYDASGALSSATVGAQYTGSYYNETYQFDNFHRASSVTRTIDSKSYRTSYEYNGASQIKKITYPSGTHVDPAYDDKGRLSGLLYDKDTP